MSEFAAAESELIGRTSQEAKAILPNAVFHEIFCDGKFSEGEPKIIRAKLSRTPDGAISAQIILSKFKVLE